jgi:hypothetical protein
LKESEEISRENLTFSLSSSYTKKISFNFTIKPGTKKVVVCIPEGKPKPTSFYNNTVNAEMKNSF